MTQIININFLAVLVAAIVNMIVGSLWYGPLFGKVWTRLAKFSEEDMKAAKEKGMGKTYAIMFLGTLVSAYVLAHFVGYLGITTMSGALQLAFWVWLGFIAAIQLSSVLFEGKPVKLYFINIFYYLVVLSISAKILVLWQ